MIYIVCDWLAIHAQTEAKPEPIVPCSCAFSWLYVFASSSDWLTALFESAVISQSNYFGFWCHDNHLKNALERFSIKANLIILINYKRRGENIAMSQSELEASHD